MFKKILLFIFSFMITVTCYASPDVTIDGFRGVYWGYTVEGVNDSGVFSTKLEKVGKITYHTVYEAKLTYPSICGIALDETAKCIFSDGKLSEVILYFNNSSNPRSCYHKLTKAIESVWGFTCYKEDYYDERTKLDLKSTEWKINDDYICVESSVILIPNMKGANQIRIGTNRYQYKRYPYWRSKYQSCDGF